MKKLNKKKVILMSMILTCNFLHAAIIYTDISDATLPTSGENFNINMDNTASAEYSFTGNGGPAIIFSPDNHIATCGSFLTGKGWDVIKGFPYGATINSNTGFYDMGDAYIDPFWSQNYPFPQNQDTYLACQFKLGTSTHYGWIRVFWNGTTLTFKDFAYENVSNTPINAGDRGISTAGVNQLDETKNGVKIYPNPVSDNIMVKTMVSFDKLRILDATGREVQQIQFETTKEVMLNLSSLESGEYLIEMYDKDSCIFTSKVFVH